MTCCPALGGESHRFDRFHRFLQATTSKTLILHNLRASGPRNRHGAIAARASAISRKCGKSNFRIYG
jgi:hypothetical protein